MVKISGSIEIPNWLWVFGTLGGWIFTLVSIYWSYQITKGENPIVDWILMRDVVEYWVTAYGMWGGIIIFIIGLCIFTILGIVGWYLNRKRR